MCDNKIKQILFKYLTTIQLAIICCVCVCMFVFVRPQMFSIWLKHTKKNKIAHKSRAAAVSGNKRERVFSRTSQNLYRYYFACLLTVCFWLCVCACEANRSGKSLPQRAFNWKTCCGCEISWFAFAFFSVSLIFIFIFIFIFRTSSISSWFCFN